MSEAVSALRGETHTGFATVTEAGLTGMVSVRADLASPALAQVLGQVPGVRQVVAGPRFTVAWMSPDELLILCTWDAAEDVAAAVSAALAGEHALVLNVSDMRTRFTVAGARADEVLMKLCPVDFATLPPMEIRRTRAAQTAVALWRTEDGFTLLCSRSVAGYMMGLLEVSSRTGGEIF